MSRWPRPTWADHDRFCHLEGWRVVRDARGRRGTHHITYELDLPDGRTLRTRVSRPPDRTDYGPQLWGHVLRDQLDVSESEFWAGVRDSVLPHRGQPHQPHDALPAEMVHLLISRVGLTDDEVHRLSKAEASARLQEFWSTGR